MVLLGLVEGIPLSRRPLVLPQSDKSITYNERQTSPIRNKTRRRWESINMPVSELPLFSFPHSKLVFTGFMNNNTKEVGSAEDLMHRRNEKRGWSFVEETQKSLCQ